MIIAGMVFIRFLLGSKAQIWGQLSPTSVDTYLYKMFDEHASGLTTNLVHIQGFLRQKSYCQEILDT